MAILTVLLLRADTGIEELLGFNSAARLVSLDRFSVSDSLWGPMKRTLRASAGYALLVLLAFAVCAGTAGAESSGISPGAMAQLQAIIDEKKARTPAQQKVDSNLLYEAKQRRGVSIAAGVRTLATGVEVGPNGEVVVDITATVSSSVLATLEALGGSVVDAQSAYRSIRAVMPLAAVETLAEHPDVIFVQRKQEAMLNDVPGAPVSSSRAPPDPRRHASSSELHPAQLRCPRGSRAFEARLGPLQRRGDGRFQREGQYLGRRGDAPGGPGDVDLRGHRRRRQGRRAVGRRGLPRDSPGLRRPAPRRDRPSRSGGLGR